MSCALPGDHRLPAVRRLLRQGPDHRGRVRGRAAREGWLLGSRRADRRRHHRLLHDPADDHDVLRRAAVEGTQVRRRPRLPPARVAAGDDRSDDHPGRRVGRRRCVPGHRRPAGGLARPVGRPLRAAGTADRPGSSSPWPPWSWSRSASSSRTGSSAAGRCRSPAPMPVSPRRRAGQGRRRRQRDQRGAVRPAGHLAGQGARSTPTPRVSTGGQRLGRRRWAACPADGGDGRTGSSGPTRCRCSPAPWS